MNAYEAAKKAMVDLGMTKTKASYYLDAVMCMGEKQAFEELTKGVLYDIQVRSNKEIASCSELADELKHLAEDAE